MSELVDMSLDDIIKRNRVSKGPRNNNQRGGPRNQSNSKPRSQKLKSLGARSGIPRSANQSGGRQTATSRKDGLARLHISNLHYNVSDKDISQLFSEIGQTKKAAVHYDKSGRSLGTAEVSFLTREAAIRAIKKYNQVPLDGRPMNITLVPSPGAVARSPNKTGRIGVKPGSGIKKTNRSPQMKGGRRAPNQRGGNKPNSRKQREPKKEVTAEELDKDLDDYTMQVDRNGF